MWDGILGSVDLVIDETIFSDETRVIIERT